MGIVASLTGQPWAEALFGLLQVVLIDLVLAGDNAVAVGMAAAGLNDRDRRRVIALGLGCAVVMRNTLLRVPAPRRIETSPRATAASFAMVASSSSFAAPFSAGAPTPITRPRDSTRSNPRRCEAGRASISRVMKSAPAFSQSGCGASGKCWSYQGLAKSRQQNLLYDLYPEDDHDGG